MDSCRHLPDSLFRSLQTLLTVCTNMAVQICTLSFLISITADTHMNFRLIDADLRHLCSLFQRLDDLAKSSLRRVGLHPLSAPVRFRYSRLFEMERLDIG